ncbi:MAG TPA: PilN domain-containing protein [Anaerohalosphaeraceae bacterium]|jgi:Tfp pilus assembly protein PilN|nr:PilN domain-containing protein [Anaerohalosphaeraceae bacterium]
MATINFVPNDYIQQRQSNRANSLYLILLVAVLAGIGMTFSVLKMRQRSVQAELSVLTGQLNQAKEQIAMLEELKSKNNTRMKVMMMTATLIEPVPRSILLACLTNNLPGGVSLTALDMKEKEKPRAPAASPAQGKSAAGGKKTGYQKSAEKSAVEPVPAPQEPETNLEIKGLAPSDIEVASYIANLSASILLDQVQLVQSEEREIDGIKYREFRLAARLKPNLKLTRKDIESIRNKRNETI